MLPVFSSRYARTAFANALPKAFGALIQLCGALLSTDRCAVSHAHTASEAVAAYRAAWFKVHKPLAFYAAWFNTCARTPVPNEYRCADAHEGAKRIKRRLHEFERNWQTMTPEDNDLKQTLEVSYEFYLRGFTF